MQNGDLLRALVRMVYTHHIITLLGFRQINFNPLSANPTEWPNTLKQFVGNFVGNFECV